MIYAIMGANGGLVRVLRGAGCVLLIFGLGVGAGAAAGRSKDTLRHDHLGERVSI